MTQKHDLLTSKGFAMGDRGGVGLTALLVPMAGVYCSISTPCLAFL